MEFKLSEVRQFVATQAGSGKTAIMEYLSNCSPATYVLASGAERTDTEEPFFVWRSLLRDLLTMEEGEDTRSFRSGPVGLQIVAPAILNRLRMFLRKRCARQFDEIWNRICTFEGGVLE